MLSKKYKIKREVFQKIISNGRMFHSPHLTLRVADTKEERKNQSRFSFIVSAKVARKAMERNLLKRRGYAVIRKNLFRIKSNYVCAFFFKKELRSLSFEDLEKEIVFLLTSARMLSHLE